MEESIKVKDLLNQIKKGVSKLEFETIKDSKINESEITVKDYFQALISLEALRETKRGYGFSGFGNIGVYSTPGLELHVVDKEEHKKFVDNLFEAITQ